MALCHEFMGLIPAYEFMGLILRKWTEYPMCAITGLNASKNAVVYSQVELWVGLYNYI